MQYEKDIEQYLTRLVEARGGTCIKVGMDGWPDRLCVLPGKDGAYYLWCELKRYDGRLSGVQEWQLLRLSRLGARVASPRCKGDVDALMAEYDETLTT